MDHYDAFALSSNQIHDDNEEVSLSSNGETSPLICRQAANSEDSSLIKEIQKLRIYLSQAHAALTKKDEIILEWMAAHRAMKDLAVALRQEGQAASEKNQHPLANQPELRKKLYTEAKKTELAKLKNRLFPPTMLKPR